MISRGSISSRRSSNALALSERSGLNPYKHSLASNMFQVVRFTQLRARVYSGLITCSFGT